MQMRRQHAARRELEQRDTDTHARQSRKGRCVGGDDGTGSGVEVGVRAEVVEPVAVLLEERLAVEVCG